MATISVLLLAGAVEAQQRFATPEEAVAALVAAAENNDMATLQQLLGPGSEDILSSGDDVADRTTRQDFVAQYRARHRLQPEADGTMVLEVGENAWPLPIPLVQRDGAWLLDGAAGAEEVVYRRIGRNELGAIAVCRGFLDAQQEYAAEGRDGREAGIYASQLFSTPGRHDGLYWPTAAGEAPSPAGEEVAKAAAEGYRTASGGPRQAYHGYYYRMLFAQGSHAPGGAYEYFVDGLLTQGVALLAWPAEYGVSGIKSFMVSHDGVVYEKDLGDETAATADSIRLFDPDDSWSPVQDNH